MVTIRAFPRLHIGLLDLADATYRKYGGAGFTVNGPPVEIQVSRSAENANLGLATLDSVGQSDLLAAMDRLRAQVPIDAFTLRIVRMPPQHIGLGTKTALILAALQAANEEMNLGLSWTMLQRLSSRGGTSGIGIHSFFVGGFLVDGGQDARDSPGFRPSSATVDHQLPLLILRASIPTSWRFHLLLAPGHRVSAGQERAFFDLHTPIRRSEALESIALLYHGIVPSVLNADIPVLKAVLREFHAVGFKRRELVSQPTIVMRIMEMLSSISECAVGMSSLGPLIYAVTGADNSEAERGIAVTQRLFGAQYLGVFSGQNSGHELMNDAQP